MLVNVGDIDADCPELVNYLGSLMLKMRSRRYYVETLTVLRFRKQYSEWNGFYLELSVFLERGLPRVVDIPEDNQNGIRELSISILDAGGPEGGLAEVEAFSESEQCGYIQPYLQITCDDNFIYEYNSHAWEGHVKVGCYCWKVDEAVKYEVIGNARLNEGQLTFGDDSDVIGVILVASAGDVHCKAVFHRLRP